MSNTKLWCRKVFAAEQKKRELKKLFLKSKSLDKKKKIRTNQKHEMNKLQTMWIKLNQKSMISDQILLKKNSIEDENYKEIYNFDRLI